MTSSMNLIEASKAVERANTILVVTHIFPDGDAIGTLVGLTNALRSIGKRAEAAVDEGVPRFLKFLDTRNEVQTDLQTGEWDLMISVDSSDEARTGKCGKYGRENSKTVINLDHHATNTGFGDIFLVNPDAVSATEVAFDWISHMGIDLTRDITMALLTGLVTDTLGFRTSNVTDRTLAIAQSLMTAGASLTEITARTLDNKTYATINLWKHVLSTVQLEDNVIHTSITLEALDTAGVRDSSDGGLSGFLIKVDEAMISAVFREKPENKVELSFRSKKGFDVAEVAFSLGGGGHKQAAGATVEGTLDEVRDRVLPLLKKAVQDGTLVIA